MGHVSPKTALVNHANTPFGGTDYTTHSSVFPCYTDLQGPAVLRGVDFQVRGHVWNPHVVTVWGVPPMNHRITVTLHHRTNKLL